MITKNQNDNVAMATQENSVQQHLLVVGHIDTSRRETFFTFSERNFKDEEINRLMYPSIKMLSAEDNLDQLFLEISKNKTGKNMGEEKFVEEFDYSDQVGEKKYNYRVHLYYIDETKVFDLFEAKEEKRHLTWQQIIRYNDPTGLGKECTKRMVEKLKLRVTQPTLKLK